MESTSSIKVVVSVINYRTPDLTINAVESVLSDIGDLCIRVVVVDNDSGDDSTSKLRAWLDSMPDDTPVDLVFSPSNTGFAGGHNQGLQKHNAEYYLVLNSDALLQPGFFKKMLASADQNLDVGLFAPKIVHDDDTVQNSCFRFHNPLSELIYTSRTGAISKLFRNWAVSIGPNPSNAEIEWASFACIMLRGEMVTQLGPMDEGYFLYFEDAAYSYRSHKAGWRIEHVPEARAVHFRGGSGPVKSLQKSKKALPKYYYASRTRFLYQAHGYLGLLAANVLWHVGHLIRSMRRLINREIPPLAKNEFFQIWTNFLKPLGPDYRPAGKA